MKPGAWRIPVLPLAANACAWAVVIGAACLVDHWDDIKDPAPRNAQKAIDAIFDEIISREDWLAAGMPSNESSFDEGRVWSDADAFTSSRRLGKKGSPQGWLSFSVERPDHMTAASPGALLREDLARGLRIAEGGGGFLPESWHVFARRRVEDHYEDLTGWCFHDNAYVHVEAHGDATREQAEGFKRLIANCADRLDAAFAGDLRPYLERLAAKAGR